MLHIYALLNARSESKIDRSLCFVILHVVEHSQFSIIYKIMTKDYYKTVNPWKTAIKPLSIAENRVRNSFSDRRIAACGLATLLVVAPCYGWVLRFIIIAGI